MDKKEAGRIGALKAKQNKEKIDFAKRDARLLVDYESGNYTVRQLSSKFNISVRQIQRIVQKRGATMTKKDRQMIAHKVSPALYQHKQLLAEHKKRRTSVPLKLRYEILSQCPYCSVCGLKPPDTKLYIDHINQDPSDNCRSNLRVLCFYCNMGNISEHN